MTRRMTAAMVVVAFAAAGAAGSATATLNDGWTLDTAVASPDGRYRLELYHGTRWQRLVYRVRYDEPGFARMSATGGEGTVATSAVIDLADSRVTWIPAGVLVATQARYRYATGEWD